MAIEKESWQPLGLCGIEYNELVQDSRNFTQKIDFYGYDFNIQIRSAHDPHLKFGIMTRLTYTLDQQPGALIFAGVILLFFAVIMLAMSVYKSYRFCIKYTFRNYLRDRRQKRYLDE